MFHLHIMGTGCDDYWNYHTSESGIMGKWFLQYNLKIKIALLSYDNACNDDYREK